MVKMVYSRVEKIDKIEVYLRSHMEREDCRVKSCSYSYWEYSKSKTWRL